MMGQNAAESEGTILLGGQQIQGTQRGSGPDHCRPHTRAKNRGGGLCDQLGKGRGPTRRDPRLGHGKARTNTHKSLCQDQGSQTENLNPRGRQNLLHRRRAESVTRRAVGEEIKNSDPQEMLGKTSEVKRMEAKCGESLSVLHHATALGEKRIRDQVTGVGNP